MRLKCSIENANDAKNICGIQNDNLKTIEELFSCLIDIHGEAILTNLEDPLAIQALEILCYL